MGNIIKSFQETITGAGFSDIGMDIAEKMLDDTLEDGLIKDVPVIRTIYALYKAKGNISDWFLAKKILYFICQIGDVDPVKRREMIQRIDESEKHAIGVGEKLIHILNRCDDIEKAILIGKVFKAYLEERITYDMFRRCTRTIDIAYINDLKDFIMFNKEQDLNNVDYQDYVSMGVVTAYDINSIRRHDPSLQGESLEVGVLYPRINETGKVIHDILFDHFVQ